MVCTSTGRGCERFFEARLGLLDLLSRLDRSGFVSFDVTVECEGGGEEGRLRRRRSRRISISSSLEITSAAMIEDEVAMVGRFGL